MWYVVNQNELYHHGIKGQKWGVRRFQNPDGTLTEAGKKRYQKEFYKRMKSGKLTDEDIYSTTAYKKLKSSETRARDISEKYYDLYFERSQKAEEIAAKKVSTEDYPNWLDYYKQFEKEYNDIFKQLNRDGKLDQLAKANNQAVEQYHKASEKLTKELLGDHRNNPITLSDGFDVLAGDYLLGLVSKLDSN